MPTSFYSSTSSCSVADLADVDLAGDVSKTATNAATAAATIAVQLDAQHQKKSPSLDELCRLTRFSRQEVRAFYRTLKQECPKGVVNEETLRDVYNRLFPEGNGGLYARHVFRTLDTQGSGGVTFTQLLLFLSSISKGSTQDRLRWTFRLYDMDGDGVIQLSELFTLIWAIHEMAGTQDNNKTFFHSTKKRATNKDECVEERDQEKRRVKLQAEKIFQRWDLNKDGLVSWEEFLTCCLRDENIASSFNYFLC